MVQTGVYRGYPVHDEIRVLSTIPYVELYIYSNPNNPNYPGYTVMKNNDGWHPPDSTYIPILSKIQWNSVGDDYSIWHYFWYIGEITIIYNNPSKYDVWISGASTHLSYGVVDDALLLYFHETDTLYSIGRDLVFQPQKISQYLQEGLNNITYFLYSGPQWDDGGFTIYRDQGGLGDRITPTYFLRVKK